MATEYHHQLLALSRSLLEGRPNRAKLHRAVSSAYYALFHLLIRDGTRLLQVGTELRGQVGRAFDHGVMKEVCGLIGKGNLPKGLQGLVGLTVSDDLRTVANVFVKLYGLRHEADYKPDRSPPFTKSQVEGYVIEVEDAFARWGAISGEPVAKAFLLALLLHKRWDR